MATISLKIRGKKNPSPLYVRFTAGRESDFILKTKILLNPKDWNNKKECFKHTITVSNSLAKKINGIKPHVFDRYNIDYMDGCNINAEWLEDVILSYFKRDKDNSKANTLVYIKYVDWWLENMPKRWISTNKDDQVLKPYLP